MFNSIFKEVTGLLDRRFILNAFLPCLIFWGLLILVAIAGTGDLTKAVLVWRKQEFTGQIALVIAFMSLVTFSAGVLASQMNGILRFYEGYWIKFPLSQWIFKKGQQWHQKNLDNIDYKEVDLFYPPRKHWNLDYSLNKKST